MANKGNTNPDLNRRRYLLRPRPEDNNRDINLPRRFANDIRAPPYSLRRIDPLSQYLSNIFNYDPNMLDEFVRIYNDQRRHINRHPVLPPLSPGSPVGGLPVPTPPGSPLMVAPPAPFPLPPSPPLPGLYEQQGPITAPSIALPARDIIPSLGIQSPPVLYEQQGPITAPSTAAPVLDLNNVPSPGTLVLSRAVGVDVPSPGTPPQSGSPGSPDSPSGVPAYNLVAAEPPVPESQRFPANSYPTQTNRVARFTRTGPRGLGVMDPVQAANFDPDAEELDHNLNLSRYADRYVRNVLIGLQAEGVIGPNHTWIDLKKFRDKVYIPANTLTGISLDNSPYVIKLLHYLLRRNQPGDSDRHIASIQEKLKPDGRQELNLENDISQNNYRLYVFSNEELQDHTIPQGFPMSTRLNMFSASVLLYVLLILMNAWTTDETSFSNGAAAAAAAAPQVGHFDFRTSISDIGSNILQTVPGCDIRIFSDGNVQLTKVMDLVIAIWEKMYPLVTSDWYGADSGDVMYNVTAGTIKFVLHLHRAANMQVAQRWDPSIAMLIDRVFSNKGLITVVNNDDDLCIVYMVAAGLALLKNPQLFARQVLLDPGTICTRILYDASTPREAKTLIDKLYKKENLPRFDVHSGKDYSVEEFIKEMEKIESQLTSNQNTPIDVYIINSLTSNRIIPGYISKRKAAERIELLAIITDKVCHCCLITDMKWVMRQTGGQLFYRCGKCHQAYFTKSLLMTHECKPDENSLFHWNASPEPDVSEMEGVCRRCHLQFRSSEELCYHLDHCFMRNKSGERFIQLADYEEEPKLHGEKRSADERLNSCILLFADFESVIKADGTHEMMSYGLYNTDDRSFIIGYSLEEFMDQICLISSRHKEIAVYFHNAMNYDANFILRYVLNEKKYANWSIKAMMKSVTKLQKLRFLYMDGRTERRISIGDTYLFLTLSLERLVNSVKKDSIEGNKEVFNNFFEVFSERYPGVSDSAINGILKKNLFPYKFFDDASKLDTPIEEFKHVFEPLESNLKYFSEGISIEDLSSNWGDFNTVISQFGCKDARAYHDIYLTCDVMELADIFTKVRASFWETHNIDLTRYLGMPSASWAAFLRFNPRLELPLYSCTRFAEFFQSMMRGGVTSAPLRYAKADSTHSIIYLDVNGLYPFVMQEYPYPCGRLIWKQDVPRLDIFFEQLKHDGMGACICVDLHIPDRVKLLTDDYPFAPEHKIIRDEYFDETGEFIPYIKKWSGANNGERVKPFVGLVGTLYDKKEYGVHWRLLKWYLEHGIEVTKVHFAVMFKEDFYLRGYVHHNIELRNKCDDELRKMAYKLCGNSIYGKTCENPMNRCNCTIVRNKDKLNGMLQQGCVLSISPIDENNSVVRVNGERVVLDKPSYIGACVLELAKLHMYTIYYDKLKKMFNDVKLVYTDTDSFIVMVEHAPNETAEELFEYIDMVSPGFIGKLGGQLKSETGTDLIDEVIALRSKFYAYCTKSGKFGERAKGVTAAAQKKDMTWDRYKDMLLNLVKVKTHNTMFERQRFSIRTVERIRELSGVDGKRYICEDGIHTHAFGYPNQS